MTSKIPVFSDHDATSNDVTSNIKLTQKYNDTGISSPVGIKSDLRVDPEELEDIDALINQEQKSLQIGGKNKEKNQEKKRAKTSNSNNLSEMILGPQESIPFMHPLKKKTHRNIATI